jgi:hypothetical protein
MDDPALKDQVRTVFIVGDDVPTQLAAMRKNASHFDWLMGASDETYESVARFVIAYGDWVRGECEKYGLSCIVRRGEFESENDDILKTLTSK